MAAGVGALALAPSARSWAALAKVPIMDRLGLQLWSVRDSMREDVAGTLARVQALGFREIEAAGLWGQTAEEFRASLDKAGLRCQSAHMGLDRLKDDAASGFAEVTTLGAKHIVSPWIAHEGAFTREDALKAAESFNTIGAGAKAAGLRFSYHCHGYEFVPSDEGTLFDTLAQNTDPENVRFQIDVFWAKAGGVDPAALIAAYPGRMPLLHIKDMQKGVDFPVGTSGAPHETNVPVGTGQIDWSGVFQAAAASSTELFYIEDESPSVWEQLPQTLEYLRSFKA
jgi:sugar phosphate isomerase/epimerase